MKKLLFFTLLLMVFTSAAMAQKMTIKDNSANVLMEINDEGTVGSITLPQGAAPGVTANKLYNVGGTLNWNGSTFADGYSLDAADGSPVDAVYVDNSGAVGIGTTTPGTILHVRVNNASNVPQLRLEQIGTGDASQAYLMQGSNYSVGIDVTDGNYKATNATNLTAGSGSTQSDNLTMFQVRSSGILDINNQSRSRAYLVAPQLVPPAIWFPIDFDTDGPLSGGYDEQAEFTVSPGPGVPGIFTAAVEGYYQVNSRTVFSYGEPVQFNFAGYVSIAIFVNGVMYAQGNNLQMGSMIEPIFNNNAPNVSDVVYLAPTDVLTIHVWQDVDLVAPLMLGPGVSQTYVSIHKVS